MDDPDFIEVIPLDDDTDEDLDRNVREVLEESANADLNYLLAIGQNKEGKWFFAASQDDPYKAMFSADQFKSFMLNQLA